MTADEAKQALKEGKKVRHFSWQKESFLELRKFQSELFNKEYLKKFESTIETKNDGWEIVE